MPIYFDIMPLSLGFPNLYNEGSDRNVSGQESPYGQININENPVTKYWDSPLIQLF